MKKYCKKFSHYMNWIKIKDFLRRISVDRLQKLVKGSSGTTESESQLFQWEVGCINNLGCINNWFNALYDHINILLEKNDEVAIIDAKRIRNEEVFTGFVEQLKSEGVDLENGDVRILIGVRNKVFQSVDCYQAEQVKNPDTDFDKDLAKDGIIRMTN